MRGSLFLPGQSDRRIADIEAGPEGLQARTPTGETASARWGELTARLGGNDDQMVFLAVTDGPTFCLDAQHLPTLRSAAGTAHAGVLAHLQRRAGGVQTRFRLAAIAAVLAILVVLGGLFLAVPWAAERTITALPITVDRQIGDAGYEQMDLGGTKVSDPVIDGAVKAMVDRLAAQAQPTGFEYRIQVVRSDQVNAFALPGGQIVVYTGLLKKATRPEQVAGVLGHEIAHVTRRHGLQGLAGQIGVMIGLQVLLGDASGLAGLAGQGAMTAILNGYSRDKEREADAEGLRMLMAAGIDPQGLPEFFNLLKGEASSEMPGMLAWMSTHPEHDERIANLRQQIAAAPPTTLKPLDLDWAAVQAAVAKLP